MENCHQRKLETNDLIICDMCGDYVCLNCYDLLIEMCHTCIEDLAKYHAD